MIIENIFNRPKIIGVVADVNQGKSMLLYHIIHTTLQKYNFNLFTYGLRLNVSGAQQVYSVAELETIQDSVIIVDELSSLFDLDNRKVKAMVENTLRLINHNNNILILCGTPENFKKFISGKLDEIFYKKTTLADMINGSRVKNVINMYRGYEKGSEVLNIPINEALHYAIVDKKPTYKHIAIPYYGQYDTKKDNKSILQENKLTPTIKLTAQIMNKR